MSTNPANEAAVVPTPESPPLALRVTGPRSVCAETGWSRAFSYRLIEEGRLPAVRVGRSLRVMRSDLIAFLEANRSTGSAS